MNMRVGYILDRPDSFFELAPDGNFIHHTALLAQSGAGKSFLLGRIIEEMIFSTKIKFLIIDTNGDFRKFNESDESMWTENGKKEWFLKSPLVERDNFNFFDNNWKTFKDRMYGPREEQMRTFWKFYDLSPQEKLEALMLLNYKDYSKEISLVQSTVAGMSAPYDFNYFKEKLEYMNEAMELEPEILYNIQNRIDQLSSLKVKRNYSELSLFPDEKDPDFKNEDIKDGLTKFMRDLTERYMVVDIPAIKDSYGKYLVIKLLLKFLWELCLQSWEQSLELPKTSDKRVPIFLIFDEIQNFISDTDENPLKRDIIDSIKRIVAEGRKYGLFLLLATQRPSKVPPAILSECENVCLLKINSVTEREIIKNLWGIPREIVDRVIYFNKGDFLIFGRWVPSISAVHSATRRTKEGGGDLPKEWMTPF